MRSVSPAILIILVIIIVVIVGAYFGYNMLFNKPNLTNMQNSSNYSNNSNVSLYNHNISISPNNTSNLSSLGSIKFSPGNSTNYYKITLYNTQFIPTPSPFQQDIAICNGSINIGNNFAYANNATLSNLINSNGSNVVFTDNNGNILYSWYEGQLWYEDEMNYIEIVCDVWWINIPNGIPANNNITIYMYIGPNNSNYYQQYYPYVGVSPNVDPSRKYDNGQKVFIAYGYFNNTFDGWKAYNYSGSWVPKATPYGIEMLNSDNMLFGDRSEDTYILPPNNGNIPLIPLIVEEALWTTMGYASPCSSINDANVIALFGNTDQQIMAANIGSTPSDSVSVPESSTFVHIEYGDTAGEPFTMLKSAVTNSILNQTSNINSAGDFYQYIIVNSTYVQAGRIFFPDFNGGDWAPLTMLDTYSLYSDHNIYANINYNPFQYPTLQIGAGGSCANGSNDFEIDNYIEWVIARAYPPNGVMPSIYIS